MIYVNECVLICERMNTCILFGIHFMSRTILKSEGMTFRQAEKGSLGIKNV